MHVDTPARIESIATQAAALLTQLQTAVSASAPFVATSGSTASVIRADAQLGTLFEDDPALANTLDIVQRTAAQMEKIAQDTAALNQRLVTLSKQLERDVTALQDRLAVLQAPEPEPE